MGWMIRGSGFESRRSRDFSLRHRAHSGFGAYLVGIKGFRHTGMTLTTFGTSLLVLKFEQNRTPQENQGLPLAAVTVLYSCDWIGAGGLCAHQKWERPEILHV
jgi:hypothetical protein